MNWKKVLAVSLALVLIVGAVGMAGCGKKEPAGDQAKEPAQVIRYHGHSEPETMDPAKMTGLPEGTIANALFDMLTRYDANSQPQAAAAESWTVSTDGLVYTFKLRDAKWSNGDPVTAEDFKFAWLRVLDPKMASDYAYQFYYIKGAEAYNGGKGKAEDVAIKVIDPKTLEVTLAAPAPQFLGLTAFQTYAPLNKTVVEAHPDWNTSPENYVSNGPFKMEKWEHKQLMTLVKNPNYWDANTVKLEKLEVYLLEDNNTAYTMYKTNKLDVMVETIPTQELPSLKDAKDYHIFADAATYYYRFNVKKKPLDNPKVRKALAMAIDRKAIVENITQAEQKPAFAWVPFGFAEDKDKDFRETAGNSYFKEDVAEAQKLLAEAGYPGGKGFPKLEILVNTHEMHQKIAQAIQEMWKQNLGINVGVTNKEWGVYLKAQQELDYDISRSGWSPDYLDPMTFMDMFVTDGGNNNTGWSNAKYDELIKQAKSTGDNAVRMKAMHDAEQILMDEMPIAPFYFYTKPTLIRENIKGVITPSFAVYAEFKWAYVE